MIRIGTVLVLHLPFLGIPAEISNSVEWKRKKAPQASPLWEAIYLPRRFGVAPQGLFMVSMHIYIYTHMIIELYIYIYCYCYYYHHIYIYMCSWEGGQTDQLISWGAVAFHPSYSSCGICDDWFKTLVGFAKSPCFGRSCSPWKLP